MPQAPTMIGKTAFVFMRAIGKSFITAVFINRWDESVGIVFVIIDLRRFEPNIVHSYVLSQDLDIVNLMFIRSYDQELKNDKGRFASHFFFPSYDISRSLQHLVQSSANAVLLVNVLCSAVN